MKKPTKPKVTFAVKVLRDALRGERNIVREHKSHGNCSGWECDYNAPSSKRNLAQLEAALKILTEGR